MRARDAITAATNQNLRCGIGDQDYIAAFDFLVLSWVWLVLERKGGGGMEWNGIMSLDSSPLLLDGGHFLGYQKTSLVRGIKGTWI